MVRAVGGDSDASAELLFEYHDRLRSSLAGKVAADLQSVVEEDDILQDAYCEAFRSIRTFQPKSDRAFFRWLETIAEHQLIDMARTQRAKKRGGEHRKSSNTAPGGDESYVDLFNQLSGGSSTPSRIVAREEAVKALKVQLASLPEDYRQAILLREIEGLSRQEVARRMGRSEDEVRGLLYRARNQLRNAMGNSSLWFSKK
jgi:RNA polymerase sigma-70 factor (ECF subfamily)